MFRSMRYHQHFLRLERGQVLVLYTDGMTEASNEKDEEFGRDRLANLVLEGIKLSAKDMIDFIRKGVQDFADKKFLDDDGTLFIIKAL
jgi:sigma-B regulation protein RsbU (phosphoserine phosphatase)